jgi:Core-2/I-Branching enzyme
VRLAYIISAYKMLDQLGRLLRRLAANESEIVVHVDQKTDDRAYSELVADFGGLSSVHFLERHTCHWGGFGHVRATLKGIDDLQRRDAAYDYVILLTGQDYPIKSNDCIQTFFEANRGTSFMAHNVLPTPWWSPRGGLDRIEYRHLRLHGRHLRLPRKRAFPPGLRPFGGGAYWCLSRECIELVSDFVAARPDVVDFFKHVDIPDEIFFQTVIMNSDLAATVANDNLRYIDWTRGVRPAILGLGDFERLKESPKLFARKFDVTQDAEVLDLIDRHLLSKGC